MGEIGRWNGHKFTVSSKVIRGFTGLQLKGGSETKDKTKSKQIYVTRKKATASEVSMTVHLHASTGCTVRQESINLIADARDGKKDYFYIAKKKLVPCKLMLTEATVKEVEISPNGTWVSADVSLTFKQASKMGNMRSGSSSNSNTKKKKKSVKKKSRRTKRKSTSSKSSSSKSKSSSSSSSSSNSFDWPLYNKINKIQVETSFKNSNTSAKKVTSAAKKYSAAKKKYTATKKKTVITNATKKYTTRKTTTSKISLKNTYLRKALTRK